MNLPPESRLCPACTLCCNGVLFADVRLQPGDPARHLAALGIKLRKHGASHRFAQPCTCLEGKLCRIYEDRPARCRSFECRLLKKVQAGEISEAAALRIIRRARRAAEKAGRILSALGDEDESSPLTRRYARVMRQPVDLAAGEEQADLRGGLMSSMAELAGLLEREFRA